MPTDPDAVPATLPRGPHDLSPETVAASQRTRLLAAIIEVVCERGYIATTVAYVIARAGVSRKTFYEHFQGKEDCFLAAFDDGQAMLARAVVEATERADRPEERLRAGYQALCLTLAENPSMARVFVVAAAEAGRAAQGRRDNWREGSIQRLRWLYETTPKDDVALPAELPEHVARAIVGAVEALITHYVETEGPETLSLLVPTIVGVARVLMLGDVAPPAQN